MSKMSKTAKASLEEQFGKPLEDRAEIERRFKIAMTNIDTERMDRWLAFHGAGELHYGYEDITVYCYSPPYEDKIALYFGDDIESADEWEAEICTNGYGKIPYGWCNKNRILLRGDWAAYYLAHPKWQEYITDLLEDLISGQFWMIVS